MTKLAHTYLPTYLPTYLVPTLSEVLAANASAINPARASISSRP